MNLLIYLLLSVPIIILAVSFMYIAYYYRGNNVFTLKIHENGKRTLLETIFYFNHFLREIFIDTLITFCIWWSYLVIYPEFLMSIKLPFPVIAILFTIFVLLIFLFSILEVGIKNTFNDFFQFRETDVLFGFGSHWNMHFLSTLCLLLIFLLPISFFTIINYSFLIFIFVIFVLLSIFFKTTKKSLEDPRWILHGAREIITFIIMVFVPIYSPISQVILSKITNSFPPPS